jgi:hypothetical protein
MTTISSWLFNILFSFNLFNAAHWRYLADLQLSNEVNKWFYIWIGIMIVTTLGTLYFLIVPWHRRISMAVSPSSVGAEIFSGRPNKAVNKAAAPAIDFSKPPRLQMPDAFMRAPSVPRFDTGPAMSATASVAMPHAAPAAAPPAGNILLDSVSSMLTLAGWTVKPGFNIGGFDLNVCAIGSDETLLIGHVIPGGTEIAASTDGDWMTTNGARFSSPVDGMSGAANRLGALFDEFVGEELAITILPIILTGGRISNLEMMRPTFEGLGIKVFDDMMKLSEFMANHRPRQLNESEKEDFAAFSDFIDTVRAHFGG